MRLRSRCGVSGFVHRVGKSVARERILALCSSVRVAAAEVETAEKLGIDTGLEVIHPLDPDWVRRVVRLVLSGVGAPSRLRDVSPP